ncbi:hypothetical protein [Gracilibacillus timonensis]|uniref:hypothetical protein n=1 Tax=Gracilibacillus timonensis TaxID=1816696 RepID=UPI00098F31D3|nr:hypothetical protein [Gracilibacillus timonensis]
MRANQKIMMYYMDDNHKVTQRMIRIVKIKDTHILAYCYFRKQVRSFKVANILSYGPVSRRQTGA